MEKLAWKELDDALPRSGCHGRHGSCSYTFPQELIIKLNIAQIEARQLHDITEIGDIILYAIKSQTPSQLTLIFLSALIISSGMDGDLMADLPRLY